MTLARVLASVAWTRGQYQINSALSANVLAIEGGISARVIRHAVGELACGNPPGVRFDLRRRVMFKIEQAENARGNPSQIPIEGR